MGTGCTCSIQRPTWLHVDMGWHSYLTKEVRQREMPQVRGKGVTRGNQLTGRNVVTCLNQVFSHIHPGRDSNFYLGWQGEVKEIKKSQGQRIKGKILLLGELTYQKQWYQKPNNKAHLQKASARQWFHETVPDSPQASPGYRLAAKFLSQRAATLGQLFCCPGKQGIQYLKPNQTKTSWASDSDSDANLKQFCQLLCVPLSKLLLLSSSFSFITCKISCEAWITRMLGVTNTDRKERCKRKRNAY